jgi:deazaflavin-dependent oxidoreductase (nitroreductase family)
MLMADATERQLPNWIQQHLGDYLSTNGEKGHIWNGVTTLLLTTKGRKTGEPLQLPLIYGRDGDNYLVVASKGGSKNHPAWYLNLAANPEVEIQVKDDRFKARARTATPEERPRMWETMAKIWPAYNDYQSKTERHIPVVVIERQ